METGKASKIVKAVWLGAVSLAFAVMFAVVLLQIFSRKIMNLPLLWSDEIATLLFVWMIYLGTLMVVHEGAMIRLDVLSGFMSARTRARLDRVFHWLFIAASLAALPGAVRLTLQSVDFRFSLSNIPWAWLYAAGPVFFALIVVISIGLVRKKGD